MNASSLVVINPKDNVAIALRALSRGEILALPDGGSMLEVLEDVPLSHKVAIATIATGAPVVKYGESIGNAARDIRRGEWVHRHNLDGSQIYEGYVADLLARVDEGLGGKPAAEGRQADA